MTIIFESALNMKLGWMPIAVEHDGSVYSMEAHKNTHGYTNKSSAQGIVWCFQNKVTGKRIEVLKADLKKHKIAFEDTVEYDLEKE